MTPNELAKRLAETSPYDRVELGRYDVIGRLGQGGMGTVYDALDRERGTRVALKTLLVPDAAAAVRLKREFRAVADLAHPNLAPVYELACVEGVWFFVMARVDGVGFMTWARGPSTSEHRTAPLPLTQARSDLGAPSSTPTAVRATTLAAEATPPPATAPVRSAAELRTALAGLAHGLLALHGAGLWHGDVKPDNVLVRPDGSVVVVDFGLVSHVDGEALARPTPTAGTPRYMAPEQLRGSGAGPASDWYGVGTMLYEALTGRVPFDADSLLDLYFQRTHHTPPSPRELLPETPAALSEVCMGLLQAASERRLGGRDLLRACEADGVAHATTGAPRSIFVGRKRELRVLEQTYGLVRTGHAMVVHAHGPSGIGKSAILRSFARGVHDVDGAQVLRGRCYERESVPYKAFDGIVDDLVECLLSMDAATVARVVPDDCAELLQIFPTLAAVPALARGAAVFAPTRDAVELRRRGWSALRQLLSSLAQLRACVVVIDDLQWADPDSATLLASFVRELGERRILVLVSYRPVEAATNPVLGEYFELARGLAVERRLVELPLAALPLAEAELLARSTLQGLGRTASDARIRGLVEEAGGVPFFVEELVRYAASRDALDGAADGPPISLDAAIVARVHALPPEQRALVEVIAVAGSPLAQGLVFAAAHLEAGALPALLALRSASLVSWSGAGTDDPVAPYHDRIREAVAASLVEQTRIAHHLSLGRVLAAKHVATPQGPWLYEAVRHLAAARAQIADPAERLAAARLGLEAGSRARSAAAFPVAFSCFERAIEFLPDDAWQTDYALALALHGGAAEAAYLSAEWTAMAVRCADVKRHARSALDQLIAWEVEIDAGVGRHEYRAALAAGVGALALLGVTLPGDPTADDIGAAFHRAYADLERIGLAGLEALPDVEDPVAAAAMRLQVRMAPAAYFGQPLMLPIIACNLLEASVARGLSPATPFALALFGIVLNTQGQFPVAHRWGELAVRLIDRWPDRRLEAATRHLVFNLVCPWMVPLRSTLPKLREVWDIGRRTGDLEYASYAAHGYVHNCMYAGLPLGPLLLEALDLGAQMRALGQVNALHVHRPFEQVLRALAGVLPTAPSLDGNGFDEAAELAAASRDGSRSGTFILRLAMGLVHFHFGTPRDAYAHFEIARAHLDAAPSVWHVPILHQFGALSALAAWSQLPVTEQSAARASVAASLDALRVLAGHCAENFAHRVALVEAELLRVDGDPERARARLDEALAIARAGDWTGDVALALELGGDRAGARDAYAAWGAAGKAARLA